MTAKTRCLRDCLERMVADKSVQFKLYIRGEDEKNVLVYVEKLVQGGYYVLLFDTLTFETWGWLGPSNLDDLFSGLAADTSDPRLLEARTLLSKQLDVRWLNPNLGCIHLSEDLFSASDKTALLHQPSCRLLASGQNLEPGVYSDGTTTIELEDVGRRRKSLRVCSTPDAEALHLTFSHTSSGAWPVLGALLRPGNQAAVETALKMMVEKTYRHIPGPHGSLSPREAAKKFFEAQRSTPPEEAPPKKEPAMPSLLEKMRKQAEGSPSARLKLVIYGRDVEVLVSIGPHGLDVLCTSSSTENPLAPIYVQGNPEHCLAQLQALGLTNQDAQALYVALSASVSAGNAETMTQRHPRWVRDYLDPSQTVLDLVAVMRDMPEGIYFHKSLRMRWKQGKLHVHMGTSCGTYICLEASGRIDVVDTRTLPDQRRLEAALAMMRGQYTLVDEAPGKTTACRVFEEVQETLEPRNRFFLTQTEESHSWDMAGQPLFSVHGSEDYSFYRLSEEGVLLRDNLLDLDDTPSMGDPFCDITYNPGMGEGVLTGITSMPHLTGIVRAGDIEEMYASHKKCAAASAWANKANKEGVLRKLSGKNLIGTPDIDTYMILGHTLRHKHGVLFWTDGAPPIADLERLVETSKLKDRLLEALDEIPIVDSLELETQHEGQTTLHVLDRAPWRYTSCTRKGGEVLGYKQQVFDTPQELLETLTGETLAASWVKKQGYPYNMQIDHTELAHAEVLKLINLHLEAGVYTNKEVTLTVTSDAVYRLIEGTALHGTVKAKPSSYDIEERSPLKTLFSRMFAMLEGEHLHAPTDAGILQQGVFLWGKREQKRAKIKKALEGLPSSRHTLHTTRTNKDGTQTELFLERGPCCLTTRTYKDQETLGWTQQYPENLDRMVALLDNSLLDASWEEVHGFPYVMGLAEDLPHDKVRRLFNLHLSAGGYSNGEMTVTVAKGPHRESTLVTFPAGGRSGSVMFDPRSYGHVCVDPVLLEDCLGMLAGEHVYVEHQGSIDTVQVAQAAWNKHLKEKTQLTETTPEQAPAPTPDTPATATVKAGITSDSIYAKLIQESLPLLSGQSSVGITSNNCEGILWGSADKVHLYVRSDYLIGEYPAAATLITYDRQQGTYAQQTRIHADTRADVAGAIDIERGGPTLRRRSDHPRAHLLPQLNQLVKTGTDAKAILGIDPLEKLIKLKPPERTFIVGSLRGQLGCVTLRSTGVNTAEWVLTLSRLNSKGELCKISLSWNRELGFCCITEEGARWDRGLLRDALKELEDVTDVQSSRYTTLGSFKRRFLAQTYPWDHRFPDVSYALWFGERGIDDLPDPVRVKILTAFNSLVDSLPRGKVYAGHTETLAFRLSAEGPRPSLYVVSRLGGHYTHIARHRGGRFNLSSILEQEIAEALLLEPLNLAGLEAALHLQEAPELATAGSLASDASRLALARRFFPAPQETPAEQSPAAAPTPEPAPVVTEAGAIKTLPEMLVELRRLYAESGDTQTEFRGREGRYIYLPYGPRDPAVYVPDSREKPPEICDGDSWKSSSHVARYEPALQATPRSWSEAYARSIHSLHNADAPPRAGHRHAALFPLIDRLTAAPPMQFLTFAGKVTVQAEKHLAGVSVHVRHLNTTEIFKVSEYFAEVPPCADTIPGLGHMLRQYGDAHNRGAAERLEGFVVRMSEVSGNVGVLYQWHSKTHTLSYMKLEEDVEGCTPSAVAVLQDGKHTFTILRNDDGIYFRGEATPATTLPADLDENLSCSSYVNCPESESFKQVMRAFAQGGLPLLNKPHLLEAMQYLLTLEAKQGADFLLGRYPFSYRNTGVLLELSLNGECLATLHNLSGFLHIKADHHVFDLPGLVDIFKGLFGPNNTNNTEQEAEAGKIPAEGVTTMSSENKTGQATPAQTTNPSLADRAKEKILSVKDQAADETSEAAWRTAVRQLIKTTREPLVALLCRQMNQEGDETVRKKIGDFLATDAGEVLLESLLSVAVTMVPGQNEKVQRLARELRVKSMADTADLLADVVMGPLRTILSTFLADNSHLSAEPLQLPAASPSATESLDYSDAHRDNPAVAAMNGHATKN